MANLCAAVVDLTSGEFSGQERWDAVIAINLPLLVPCDVDVSWDGVDVTMYHAHITTSPGVFATTTNGFSTTDTAHFLILPEIGQILGGVLE